MRPTGSMGPRSVIVTLKLLLGSRSKGLAVWKEHDRFTADYDVSLTWEQAFMEKFGRSPDPQLFSVRRNTPDSPHHHLKEDIRGLVNEYKNIRKEFIYVLVENTRVEPVPPVPRAPRVEAFSTQNVSVPTPKPKPAAAAGSSRNTKSQFEISMGRSYSPVDSSYSQSTAPITSRSPNKAAKNGIENELKGRSQGAKRSGSAMPESMLPPARKFRFETFEEDDILEGKQNEASNQENDDTFSQYTTASQDSQDELERLGIPYEDIKPLFVKRAMEKFTNSHLLEIKSMLKDAKKDTKRWMKWLQLIPAASNCLRELFEI